MEYHQRPIFALCVRIAGAASFATMAMLIKIAGTSGIALPEIMFWRQFLTVPLVLGFLAIRDELYRLKTDKPRTHALRSVVGMIGMVCNFSAVLLLPLDPVDAANTGAAIAPAAMAVAAAPIAQLAGEHVQPLVPLQGQR